MSDLERRLASLSPEKQALLEKMLARNASSQARAGGPVLQRRSPEDGNPLSFAEQRLWIVDQIEPNHPFYNMPLAARVTGDLCFETLRSAFAKLVERHDTLRTTYHLQEGEVVRRVHPAGELLPEVTHVAAEQLSWDDLQRHLREDARRPFDVTTGPLIRCHLYQTETGPECTHVVLLVMHHIVSDGWSMAVLLREWADCYDALKRGVLPSLSPLEVDYGDFAVWQRKRLEGEKLHRELAYWEDQLRDAPAVLELPLDHPRPTIQDFDGRQVHVEIPAELGRKVHGLAAATRATPYMVLMAAYAAMLSRYSRQNDVCLGSVVANRQDPALEPLIGFFVNTLVIRCRIEPRMTFHGLVEQVRETTIAALQHQDLPFERLVESLAPGRDRSHSPLFQAALVVQNMPQHHEGAGGLEIEPLHCDFGTAKHDLTLLLSSEGAEEGRGFTGRLEYRSRLFEEVTVRRLWEGMLELLRSACNAPELEVTVLPVQSPASTKQLHQWQRGRSAEDRRMPHTDLSVGDEKSVTNLADEVLRHASVTPEAPAVVFQDETICYRGLEEATRRWALNLQAMGLQPQEAVAVCLPRSKELLLAMLAIWRAGGVYVPVDLASPEQRKQWLAEDAGARLIISEKRWWPGECVSPSRLDVDADGSLPTVQPADLAYIIYTSGSTGRPKGVEVTHENIVRFLRGHAARMKVNGSSRVLHSLSPSFDGGFSEPLLALSRGGCVVVANDDQALDPEELMKLIRDEKVNVAKFPPPKLALIDPERTPDLRTVSSGGDTLTGELARRWLEAGRRMLNGYGPTEATVGCAMHELSLPVEARPPIGTPMAGQSVYIVETCDSSDRELRLAPIGVPGEICIGGSGVARGYRNLPDETRERFVEDPWSLGQRMYRTGDLGRWRYDGVLEFLGRIDEQVKIRGYRIEPNEVAAAIEKCDVVEQAIVAPDKDAAGETRLVAYVAPPRDQFAWDDDQRGQVDAWQSLFEQTHRAAPVALDPEFNIAGWIDSFTGRPIPDDEMRKWADNAAARILAQRPRRVLEVGCGTGLILHRVAGAVDEYVGVDFLESSLEQVRSVLDQRDDRDHVRLLQRAADDLSGLPAAHFDMVVLNSVAQYFPDLEYFVKVLHQAERRLAVGGRMFLGDLRNLDLHNALAAAIELSRAEPGDAAPRLLQRTLSRIEHEEELLLAPKLFREMVDARPRWQHADIQLKQDASKNELARFRYDVMVSLDVSPKSKLPTRHVEAANGWDTLERIVAGWEASTEKERLVIDGLTNRRVAAEQWLWRRLQDRIDAEAAVLRQTMDKSSGGLDPAEIYALTDRIDAEIAVRWSEQAPEKMVLEISPPRSFDATPERELVERNESVESSEIVESPPVEADTWRRYANHPLRDKVASRLVPQIYERLREQLPDYMLPSAIVVLPELPRTTHGKIDRRALPPPPVGRPGWAAELAPPENDEERLVIDVWESMLGIQPIGANDDFFELGGHSLLAVRVLGEIQRRCNANIPLAALFHDATPRRLARMIREPESAQLASSLVPLNRGKSGTPLFCIHPAGGTVFCYMPIAKRMGDARPVYGLQAVGVDGQRPPHETMEEMAEHYSRVVRQTIGDRPCHLCGWSLGGNIAYEVARRLKAQGVPVGVVALLDSGAVPDAEKLDEADFLHLVMALFPGEDHLPLTDLQALPPVEQMEYFADRARRAGLIPEDDPHGGRHIYQVFQKNIKVIHQHRTLPYDGTVELFRPSEQDRTGELFDDPLLGWAELTQVHRTDVPGDHAHLLQEPNVEILVERLESVLSASDAADQSSN